MKEDELSDPRVGDNRTEYASLLARVVSTFIDGGIVLIMFLTSIYYLNLYSLASRFSVSVAFIICYVVYFTWPIARFAQTPGHVIMKIRVIKSSGDNLGIIGAFFRYVFKAALGVFSFVTYGFTNKRQGLHDMVVDSIVVYK